MKQITASLAALVALAFAASAPRAAAHCQVPCGIYGDPARFVEMLEHTETITKAMAQINELAGKDDAQSAQQLARWVANKESHADAIQKICQQYFLAQRVKIPAGDDKKAYFAELEMVHHIIVHAMKCKQTVDGGNAAALKASIEGYQKAYLAKKK